ncbi:GDP-mannose 4,6-dehydratase [Myxococcota bacterium]|nr:GDP-mannose 4,6-dehydratase [Myxococcota bacterium]
MSGAPRALITGITGQDGSYLTELLLDRGYEVHGLVRRAATDNLQNLRPVLARGVLNERLFLHFGDLREALGLHRLLERLQPREVYNLGAQSDVALSFELPAVTTEINAVGTTLLLEAVREAAPQARFYQASSSEMFGRVRETPQRESTPFYPRSPYAASKVHGYWMTVNMRESWGLFACNGILFNHESPRRGERFVTRKIARGVADIARGRAQTLTLGNLDARRDWGYAPEYVEAMWRMLQRPAPDDYVIATGESHSVQDFVEAAFAVVGLPWRDHVRLDDRLRRPAEVDALLGDASKAKELLGWTPQVRFEELVRRMVEGELSV